MSNAKNLSRNIFIALILGALVGIFLPQAASYVSFLGLIFKSSLAMIVMPIVLTSILCGLESVGDVSKLTGLGIKTIVYYLSTTLVAVTIGILLVTSIKPGVKSPDKKIEASILAISEQDPNILPETIAATVAQSLGFSEGSPLYRDLENSLLDLAQNGATDIAIKEGALNLIGSLELRAKLDDNKKPGQVQTMSMADFVNAQIKKSLINPFEALAEKHVLAVIVFTFLFGGAMTTIGSLGDKFFEINRAINQAIIKIIDLIMAFAPFGVFGLIVDVTSSTGPEVFSKLGLYALCVVIGLMIHLFIVLPSIGYYFSRRSPIEFFKAIRPALAIGFSTSSSSATLPITMKTVEENLGVRKRISQFCLPLGATVNMDGTALYEAVAAVFIAQLYGVSLGIESQIIVAITAALAAIGTAGIPAAGTVTMALVLSAVGLPIEGIGILLAIDRPLDMCRTAVNIAGDATGCLVLESVSKDDPVLDQVRAAATAPSV